jgi:phytoene synthase
MDDHAYCAAQVRSLDSDRYVTALFAPASRRSDLLALYAFNLELARSREAVSEPALGRIRLQWWRDAIAECYEGRARRHQVVQRLAAAIERHQLSRHLFERIIDAREVDFDPSPPERLEHLVAYADATSGALSLLALEVLGARNSKQEQAAAAVGMSWALTGMARGLRHLLLTGRSPLPLDLMKKYGLTQAGLQSLKRSDSLCKTVEEIAVIALNSMDEMSMKKSGRAAPALLPSILARAYLKRLAGTGYNPFDERNMRPLSYRAWRLMIPALTGRI